MFIYNSKSKMMTSPSPLLMLSTVNICLDFLIYPFFFDLHLGPFFFCLNFLLLYVRPDVDKFSVFVYLEIVYMFSFLKNSFARV